MVTLRCDETPQLKLGIGTTQSWTGQAGYFNDRRQWVEPSEPRPAGDVIVFRPVLPDPEPGVLAPGYASFDEADFPLWREWIKAPGTPHIVIIDERTGLPTEETESLQATVAKVAKQSNPARVVSAPAKKEPTAKQLAAREAFAERSRAQAKKGAHA